MAGTERVELPLTEPESAVLPLDEVPICHFVRLSAQGSTIRESPRTCNQKFWRSYAPRPPVARAASGSPPLSAILGNKFYVEVALAR